MAPHAGIFQSGLQTSHDAGALQRAPIVEEMLQTAATTIAVQSDDPGLIGWLAGVIGPAPELRMVPVDGGASLALVDDRMPDADDAIRVLTGRGNRCLVLSDGADAERLLHAVRAGAHGCVAREADASAMRANLMAAARGTLQVPGRAWSRLVIELSRAAAATATQGSTADRALIESVIAERRFDLVFQPIADLRSGQIVSVESLARFTAEPAQPPDAWLADAEAVGLRVPLEHELLRAALASLPELPPAVGLSVNLSPQAAIDRRLMRVLEGAPLHRVVLEITDHHQLVDYEPLSEALAEPRAAGLRIAVDDSGQGVSSLQHVAQLRPSIMKLNRTLTRDIDADPTKRALAYALASFATQLGASIVAEGLETVAELQTLRAVGAPLGQGYLLARPRPLKELDFEGSIELPAADDGPVDETAGPKLTLRGAAAEDLREATRAVLRFLQEQHPSMTFVVAHLDYALRRHTVVSARGPLAGLLEPGVSTALEDTMCFHMVAGRGPRLCPDLAQHPLYDRLPAARRLDAGSYLGAPIEMPEGTRVGSVFGVSRGPASFGSDDLHLLTHVTRLLSGVLVRQTAEMGRGALLPFLRELARTDELTGVVNGPGFTEAVAAETSRPAARRTGSYVSIEVEDLNSLRAHYGHAVGDLVLKDVAAALTASVETTDVVGRVGDKRFGALLLRRPHVDGAPLLVNGLGPRIHEAAERRELTLALRVGSVALEELPSPDGAWDRAAEGAQRLRVESALAS